MAKKVIVKVTPPAGDPAKGAASESLLTNRTPIAKDLDLRDRLAELVGKGNTLSPDDKASIYGSLTAQLGQEKAMKIMNHAYLFNQRPDVLKLPLEDKLRSFYTIGSNDPDVNQVIAKSKTLGYGVLPGFRGSASNINQELSGRVSVPSTQVLSPEVQKKVMLQVGK